MCGIAGTVGFGDRHLVERMTGLMVHRGPDDHGLFESGDACLGHRRLSIIDLSSAGRQPMLSQDGRLVIVYNGEVYNFRELRRGLESKGRHFHTDTDTEVVLQVYDEYGVDGLAYLEGMFAFGIWDERARSLFLARDRVGIKPLYYCLHKGGIAFASEIKPLCLLPEFERRVNARALRSVIRYISNLEQETMLKSIYKLPAGEHLYWRNGAMERRRYWSLPAQHTGGASFSETTRALREQLIDSVESHLVSDVPVGVALSGGLDSSGVVAAMSHLGVPIKTFTAGHGENDPDVVNARIVAEHFATDHHETILDTDVLEDLLPRVLWHLEEPLGLGSSAQMYLNYERARSHAKVLLIGEGADELFGGYSHHKIFSPTIPLPAGVKQDIFRRGYSLADSLPKTMLGAAAGWTMLGRMPPTPLRQPEPRFGEPGVVGERNTPLYYALQYDQRSLSHRLLKQADAMGMSGSIELRVPYLDRPMMELAATIPDRFKIRGMTGKHVLRQALKPMLPAEICSRTKRSFQLRFNPELFDALVEISERLFTAESVARRGWFDFDSVIALQKRNFRRSMEQRFWGFRLWILIMAEVWARMYIDRPPWQAPPSTLSTLLQDTGA